MSSNITGSSNLVDLQNLVSNLQASVNNIQASFSSVQSSISNLNLYDITNNTNINQIQVKDVLQDSELQTLLVDDNNTLED